MHEPLYYNDRHFMIVEGVPKCWAYAQSVWGDRGWDNVVCGDD